MTNTIKHENEIASNVILSIGEFPLFITFHIKLQNEHLLFCNLYFFNIAGCQMIKTGMMPF